MSIKHSIMLMLMKHMSKDYDPNHPVDYIAMRESQERSANRFTKLPKDIKVENIKFANNNAMIFKRIGNPTDKIILYIHGGGFTGGSANSRSGLTSYLAKNWECDVLSINYRLAPENPFPAGLEDCFTAYKELLKTYTAKNILVMGESAGGNLILSICFKAQDEGVPLPACIIPISPSLQYSQALASYSQKGKYDYLQSSFRNEVLDTYFKTMDLALINSPYASPLYGNYSGFPPIIIIASSDELLSDEAILLYNKVKNAKGISHLIQYPKLMHAYAMFTNLPESRKALEKAHTLVKNYF